MDVQMSSGQDTATAEPQTQARPCQHDPMPRNGRFPIRYSAANTTLLTLLGLAPKRSFVDLDGGTVRVKLGWGFSSRIPREHVVAARPVPPVRFTIGAHGWRGRWLVNGARDGLVEMDLAEPVRAFTAGFPIRLRQLVVSMEDPDAFLEALGVPPAAGGAGR
jgi:hypothetical protein